MRPHVVIAVAGALLFHAAADGGVMAHIFAVAVCIAVFVALAILHAFPKATPVDKEFFARAFVGCVVIALVCMMLVIAVP